MPSVNNDFTRGRMLALLLPFPVCLLAPILASPFDSESALGMFLALLLFVGVAQLLYLLPIAAVQLVRGRVEYVMGIGSGAAFVAAANLGAWGLGWWMGVW